MNDKMSYTEAMERLEKIMSEIQGGAVDIDNLSVLLKEASALITFCRAKLYSIDEEVKSVLKTISEEYTPD